MSDEEREAFLAEAHVAILGTVDAKNRPHAAPVWYLYEDGEFVVSTGRGSQKHLNLERNPALSLTIDSRTLPYYAVMMRGTATIGPPISEEDRLRLAVRYLGADIGRRYAESTRGEDGITLRVRPSKIIVYDPRVRR
jgi:PPOX class probable F420-dependent enzyme